jgi:hypothetical protein
MKKLIVSGCSYTVKDYISSAHPEMDCSWPKWPEMLAKKLNMEIVNLAFNGAGNRFILQTLLEAIERTPKEEIGMVIAAWSQANRDDWQEYHRTGPKLIPIKFDNEKFVKGFKWQNMRINRLGNIFGWVRESLLGYITLQNVCKRYDIPLRQFQMIGLYDGWVNGLERTEEDQLAGLPSYVYDGDAKADRKQIKLLIKEYEPFIDNTFLGYKKTNNLTDKISPPFWGPIEGSVTSNEKQFGNKIKIKDSNSLIIDDVEYATTDIHRISKLDQHPNELGQQKLLEAIYDRLG